MTSETWEATVVMVEVLVARGTLRGKGVTMAVTALLVGLSDRAVPTGTVPPTSAIPRTALTLSSELSRLPADWSISTLNE